MSDLMIALLLVIPIVIVVALLNYQNKRKATRKQQQISSYITDAAKATGFSWNIKKELIHQTVLLDEETGNLLVVDHKDGALSHALYNLDSIKQLKVQNIKQTNAETKQPRAESYTTHIVVNFVSSKTNEEQSLVFYDHVVHNIYYLSELEKEAWQLHKLLTKTKNYNALEA